MCVPMLRRPALLAGLLLMLTLVLSAVAPAQAQPAGDTAGAAPPTDAVLAALASDDYGTRQEMTQSLLRRDDLTLEELVELFAGARTPEQRHRLLDVARHHALRQERQRVFRDRGEGASLGLSHEQVPAGSLPGLRRPAIQVISVLPGFPAYAYLEPGDLIIEIQGRPLPDRFTAEQFRDLIKAHEAGDRLSLVVLRRGERVSLSVPLASAPALLAMYDPATLGLRPPFRARWQEARATLLSKGPTPAPLRVDASAEDPPPLGAAEAPAGATEAH